MSTRLAPSTAKPPPRSKMATRYGPARYGTPTYGWKAPAARRPGTLAF